MFGKILIANRGEIACRIIKTCKRLGIATVAVYSDADRSSPHTEMADEAVRIGPPEAAKSYLAIDAILDACAKTGAEAVHPGYGFLSERAAFPQALEAAGIVFIGPNAAAIEAMGDKIESKRRADAAGVSTVPGGQGAVESAADALKLAEEIGYPVMIKASAGGGGKGMRIAHSAAEVGEGFERARSEAATSFGDDRVFVEKFITEPRHIEIQVLGDKHGNVIHLLERECSIQRRNQKVIEEAPSPLLTPETRAKMGAQAVALATAVDYDSAGTVEFVADQNANFYFLEMNTRLQVEHPVTEFVTGVDLVEQMLRVAAGEKLALRQEDIKPEGWAIEARLYAEDPERGFLPSTGRLRRLRLPGASEWRSFERVDKGVVEGSEISRFYDPMIAKVVVHGDTRDEATERMSEALDTIHIDGIRHNATFLAALMAHPRWQEGRLSTGFIAEEFPDSPSLPLDRAKRNLIAAIASIAELEEAERREKFGQRSLPDETPYSVIFDDGERVNAVISRASEKSEEDRFQIQFEDEALLVWQGEHPGRPHEFAWCGLVARLRYDDHDPLKHSLREALFKADETVVTMGLQREQPGRYGFNHLGSRGSLHVYRPRIADLMALMPEKRTADGGKRVLCPMPGLVVSLSVSEGDKVEAGQQLAVIEAMKMENVIRAEQPGKVKRVAVAVGDSLAVDAVILELE
ncbi:MAG: acetyl/propionyl/methylcrotonyl-CoA carboxylase subunit alpha [Pseudomonadota bacterium]